MTSVQSSSSISLKLLFDTREFLLENRRLRLGRSDHLDITIKGDPLISSNHCTITNGVLLDAGSTNGTYLNSQRVTYNKKMQLQHGDVITLGETKLRIVEIKDGEPPIDTIDTAPPGTTPSVAANALTATVRENKDRRRVGFAEDAVTNGERSGTPSESRPNETDLTQPQHITTNGGIIHDGSHNSGGSDSYVPSSRASVELSDNNSHMTMSHDGSSSDDDVNSDSKTNGNRGPTPKRVIGGGMNRTKKAATKAPTARVSALAQALAAERAPTPVDNSNGIIAVNGNSSNDNDDPLSWLPRHGHGGNTTSSDGIPRQSPFAISADAFDSLSHSGGLPPSSHSSSSSGSISPSAPSELSADEARIWELQRALQKSESALAHLKKTSSQQQRNRTMSAHKAKLELLEAKCQALEFQVFYGDTQKDRDIEELKEALRVATAASSSVASSSNAPPNHAPLPVPHQLTARVSNGTTSDDIGRLRSDIQQLRAEATARTAELATVREQHQTAVDHSARLRTELEAAQRQVQISQAVAAAATAAAAATPAMDNNNNNHSHSSNSSNSNNEVTDRLSDITKKLDRIDTNVTTIARDNAIGPFNRQQSIMLMVLVVVMAIVNRLF